VKGKFRKLSQISFDELRVRSSQAVSAFTERRTWSGSARLVTDDAFLRLLDARKFPAGSVPAAARLQEYFRSRSEGRFFASFTKAGNTITALRQHFPKAESAIVGEADRIAGGNFDLLGFRNLSFGKPIDWHLEPVAGKRAPLEHWSRLDFLDSSVAGDKKIIWELNRHQYFVVLGQAYWLTGDERYARTFVEHLESWIEQNPPKTGINWASSLEISFRSISWLWAFHFFKDSPTFTSAVFLRALKLLYLHARHIETFLSTYFSPNTHLTGEALGLFYLGTVFPEFKEAKRWRETGRRILLSELDRHVKPDGVYFEQTSYYHRYTTDFYIHFLILSRASGEEVPPAVEAKLTQLLEHLLYTMRPDGTTPLFGDDDGGRVMMLTRRPANDFRETLATGAALFARPDYKFAAGDAGAEALWLLGTEGLRILDDLQALEPAQQSRAFPDGGYYVMRDGWSARANYLLFDAGPHGTANCGHAHADALAFELAANGRTLLVDPGTYTYTGSKELRDWFRSSAAHNALTIDEQSSSVPDGPFSWQSTASCQCHVWMAESRFDYLAASHNGYEGLPDPVEHLRSVLFLKGDYWIIRDQIRSAAEHQIKLWFHFDTGVAPLSSKNDVYVVSENAHSTRLQLSICAPGGEWTREGGWVSSCYGEKGEAPVFGFKLAARGATELVTFLLPQTSGVHPRPVVREIEATEGRAFEINVDGKHDVLLLRGMAGETAGWVETTRLAADFEITWARFANEQARLPDELVLIGGQTLEVEGRRIVNSGDRIESVTVTRFGDEFV
jgi:hypothetical protein